MAEVFARRPVTLADLQRNIDDGVNGLMLSVRTVTATAAERSEQQQLAPVRQPPGHVLPSHLLWGGGAVIGEHAVMGTQSCFSCRLPTLSAPP